MNREIFFYLSVAFLASTSASESVDSGCEEKKDQFVFDFWPEALRPVAVKGNCSETGLGWIGKPYVNPNPDTFFTNWTEFFLQPECVNKIEVYIKDDDGKRRIETRENLNATNLEGQNPVLTTDQSEELICNEGKKFESTIVIYSRGNHSCFEITQDISLIGHKFDLTLSDHFLNNKVPVSVYTVDGAKIFWRKGMMDKCVKAIEWTIEGITNTSQKNTTKNKDEDSIFIEGKCKAQNVILTYVFGNTSIFVIEDTSLEIEIKDFPEVCAREEEKQKEEENREKEEKERSKSTANKDGDIQIMIGSAAGGFVLLIFVIIVVAIVIMRRSARKTEEDLQRSEAD